MRTLFHRLASDGLHLIAPSLCPACDSPLAPAEGRYCLECRASLEPAPFPRDIFTEVAANFSRDELALSAVGSLYTFNVRGPVQKLIHAVKYKGCYELGAELGSDLGRALMMFSEFQDVELIVPVPLHHARLRERGYNQAEAIGRGIARTLRGSRVSAALMRARHTISQTTLDAGQRRRNVGDVFRTIESNVRDRIVLICDDVCTTGATLNACAERLLQAGAARVVAATVARDLSERVREEMIPDISKY